MRSKIRGVLVVFFATIVLAAGLKSCVVDAYKIPTSSMSETLLAGDYLLVNKFVYGARTPEKILFIPIFQIQLPKIRSVQRGDVVVFNFPGEPDEVSPVHKQFLVKRCVAVPGDTVEIMNGNIIVNGYRASNSFSQYTPQTSRFIVPFKGMNVVLDSGSLKNWNIFIQREGHETGISSGKIFINSVETSTYSVKRNYYYIVGDNASNSYDSRDWGFVPEENIFGKAAMVYWSKGENGIRWERIGTVIK